MGSGRSLKDPEQEDYFQAMEALHDGWDLLLKSATIYHQSRERQTDDATTERLREEAHRIYQQGVEKVREANRLRKAADEKRSARKRAAPNSRLAFFNQFGELIHIRGQVLRPGRP